jgi:hypothetical protein
MLQSISFWCAHTHQMALNTQRVEPCGLARSLRKMAARPCLHVFIRCAQSSSVVAGPGHVERVVSAGWPQIPAGITVQAGKGQGRQKTRSCQ